MGKYLDMLHVTRPIPPRRSPILLLLVAAGALLSLSACDDDSPDGVTRDGGTTQPDAGTDVDDLEGDGIGTVLPRDTSPQATDAPNPNAAGGGAGAATSAP